MSTEHDDIEGVTVRSARTSLRTLERGLAVLELVASAPAPITVKLIAQKLGLNTTTSYHIVNTLRASHYLERDTGGMVTLGAAVVRLSSSYERSGARQVSLLRIVEDLAEKSGETAYVSMVDPSGVSILGVFEGNQSLRVGGLEVGYSGHEHQRASGKAVLAFLGAEDQRAVLESRLAHLAPGEARRARAELEVELERVRATGLALDNEQFEAGICCVAVPFFGRNGRVEGAITLSGPTVRSALLFGEYANHTRQASADATRLFGGAATGSPRPKSVVERLPVID